MISRRPPAQQQENRTRRRTRRSNRDRKRRTLTGQQSGCRGCSQSFVLVCSFTAFIVVAIFLWLSVTAVVLRKDVTLEADNSSDGATDRSGSIRGGGAQQMATNNHATAIKPMELRKRHNERKAARRNESGVRAASIDQIVETLMGLARMPTKDLRAMLEGPPSLAAAAPADPFHLSELRKGQCPWSGDDVIEWLPERPLLQPSEWFRQDNDNFANINGDKARKHNSVSVYYEHLSKAGGTSFCTMAKANMPKEEIPRYYCMPSEPGMLDARVGSWSRKKLVNYFVEKPRHRLLSNEWEPFNLDFLELQMMSDLDLAGGNDGGVYLLFVTTIRNPINRLLSAYKFWGILNNPADEKPSVEEFLQRRGRRANRWKMLSDDFAGNVGRYNFATWKFSGGQLPVTKLQLDAEQHLKSGAKSAATTREIENTQKDQVWRKSFETAVKTLAKFDLAIPMELFDEHHEPLQHLLGWTNFEKSHVVNMGKVQNNDATTELNSDVYDVLWEANKLDFVLYYWTCAIYLARLNCADLLR
mmetsp:Transcript_34341/g.100995  ORF Transcript_34341/g.100995 Transcript_34341/m.100995 type:complete len:530 (+) Transcript_34341:61-1650(+)